MTIVRLVFLFFVIAFGFIMHRLFVIQVLSSDNYIPIQKFVTVTKDLSLRGEIFDTNKTPLAVNTQEYTVYGNTDRLRKEYDIRKSLQNILKIKDSTMSAILDKKQWQKIKSGVSTDTKDKIEKYYPTYINIEDEWVRAYPEGSMSAQVLGFVGRDDIGNPKGYVGVEGYFEQELRGLPSVSERESDLRGVSFTGGASNGSSGRAGMSLRLTIDRNLQKIVEDQLYKGVEHFDAKQGCAIVMEPYTGKIRAIGCVPSFSPEKYYEYKDADFTNGLISTIYEPGSTFKPLVVAMGLDTKSIKSDQVFDEKGPYRIGEYTIQTWNNEYSGKITTTQILEKSSNVGMVKIIEKIKKNLVNDYLNKLGFREKTGIEIQGETTGIVKDSGQWYPIDYATLSFGQGIAITPIQLVAAFSALANDGYVVKPTIIDDITDSSGKKVYTSSTVNKRTVYSPKTISTMKKMLNDAIEHSEATYAQKPAGYSFCGKTGTSQIPIEGHYDPTKTIASFIGFFPCDKPKMLIFVMYKEPKGSIWGSETAAPTFFEIANRLILYYNIAP
ncbi:MAG: penicillin-binding protein 2 [Candidatus Roizmanbacteria bacterium]|nr:penicillin-binding protein 2 [Candidatus Roizmanbacteria bacterium]